MITHNIPFEDEIRQTCLKHHKPIDLISGAMEIILKGLKGIQMNHSKQTICVKAIEVLL